MTMTMIVCIWELCIREIGASVSRGLVATLVRGALPANNLVFSFFYLVYFFLNPSLWWPPWLKHHCLRIVCFLILFLSFIFTLLAGNVKKWILSAFARLCSSTRALFVVGKGGVMWFFLLAKWVGVMWWLLIWRHLSSPENSRLPISTNPCTTTFPAHTPSYSRAKNAKNESEKWKWKCTTTFPTHTLQLHIAVKMQKGSPLHLSAGQYPPAAPHCQMSIGEYRRGINNPACSQNTCVTRHRQDRQNNIWAFLPSYGLCYNRCKTCLHFV